MEYVNMAASKRQPYLPSELDREFSNLAEKIYEAEGLLGMSQPPQLKEGVREAPLASIRQLIERIACASDAMQRIIEELKETKESQDLLKRLLERRIELTALRQHEKRLLALLKKLRDMNGWCCEEITAELNQARGPEEG